MDQERLQQQIKTLAGGQDNVRKMDMRNGKMYVSVLDAGIVSLEALKELEGVSSAELTRGKLVLDLQEIAQKEEPKMAKKKLDYPKVARELIEKVGGKENINSVRHCITRVRFTLKDESKANDEVVKNIEGVISVVHGGGEYMCVIGDQVGEVYDAVVDQLGSAAVGDGKNAKEKTNPVMALLNIIVGSVGPCLNFICAGGIIKGICTLLSASGLLTSDAGLYILLSAAGDAIFYFLPIFLGMNMAKTLKGDPFLGAILGACLCYPTINGVDLALFGINFNYTYTSTFLPVLAVVALAVPFANLMKKVLPGAVKNFLGPAITMMLFLPLGYAIIGPIVSAVGNVVNVIMTALMTTVPVLAGIIFGALYQVLVLFGIHSAVTSFAFISLLSGNPDYIMAIGCTVSFAQIGVVLGMYLKSKDQGLKDVALPAFLSGVFGVTEPAIYGVTLPRIKFFILSCIGGGLTGAIIMLTDTQMFSFTGLGVFTLLGMVSETQSMFWPIVACVVPFIFCFVLAFILFKDEVAEAPAEIEAVAKTEIEAPVAGKVVALSEVPDATFADGLLGHGIAVEPSEGKVYAPFDGTCETMFDTLHAMGLQSENGISLLIHVGLETVGLNGAPFTAHVKSGDKIKKGQLLLEFDMDAIKAAGLPTITPVLVTNEDEVGEVTVENGRIIVGK